MTRIFKYSFFATILLGYIAFGYMIYHLCGPSWTFILTGIFIAISVIGIMQFQREIEEAYSKRRSF